jgi:orotate phosphoribosyltransferase
LYSFHIAIFDEMRSLRGGNMDGLREVANMMANASQRLRRILAATSVLNSATERFSLASGATSSCYIDCKKALSHPEARLAIAELIFGRIESSLHEIDAIGGLALGAYPIALAVSDDLYRRGRKSVRVFVVRKEPKQHGLRKLIEGDVGSGDRALIVDDVITTGSSAIEAIQKAREVGLLVNRVIALVDREEESARARIEAHSVQFEALFTLSDFVKLDVNSGGTAGNSGSHTARPV